MLHTIARRPDHNYANPQTPEILLELDTLVSGDKDRISLNSGSMKEFPVAKATPPQRLNCRHVVLVEFGGKLPRQGFV